MASAVANTSAPAPLQDKVDVSSSVSVSCPPAPTAMELLEKMGCLPGSSPSEGPLLEQISKIKTGKSRTQPTPVTAAAAATAAKCNNQSPPKPSEFVVFDSVPFTPSQGVKSPSPHHPLAYGWSAYSPFNMMKAPTQSSPNTVLHPDGSSDASNTSPVQPVCYTLYPMAYSPYAEPPSPLMGTPVGTPTAMMFPQTPFAGAPGPHGPYSPCHYARNCNPFQPDQPASPAGQQYYHPFNSSFQPSLPMVTSVQPPPPPPREINPYPALKASPPVSACSVEEDSPLPPSSAPSRKAEIDTTAPQTAIPTAYAAATAADMYRASVAMSSAMNNTGFAQFGMQLPPMYQMQPIPPPSIPTASGIYDHYQGMLAAASLAAASVIQQQTPLQHNGLLYSMPLMGAWPMSTHLIPGDGSGAFNNAYGLSNPSHGFSSAMSTSSYRNHTSGYGVSSPPNSTCSHTVPSSTSSMHHQMMMQGGRGGYQQHRPRRGNGDIRFDLQGKPRLNARQRRTLKRAWDRAITAIKSAGQPLLQLQDGSPGAPGCAVNTDCGYNSSDGSECDNSNNASKSPDLPNEVDTARYMDAALSVASGKAGPHAAAAAKQVLTKVAADIDDVDLVSLISLLSKKQDGVVDDKLIIRDLQIIQNLISSLKTHSDAPAPLPSCNNRASSYTLPSGSSGPPVIFRATLSDAGLRTVA
eukprot:gene30934-35990_t